MAIVRALYVLTLILVAGGCASKDPIWAWQTSLVHYIVKEGNGDLNALRNVRNAPARKEFGVIGASKHGFPFIAPRRTDVTGVLLGHRKIVGSHSGISLAADGPSQMSLPDLAWFRSWTTVRDHRGNPACYVLQPADAYAAYALTMRMAEHLGACYMRTVRPDVEFIYNEASVFNLGGLEVLTEGRDLLIVTAGYMVHECNKVLDTLDQAGIDATLVDLYCLPFDAERLLDLANENGGNILTVEDNYGGGLGSAVADAVTDSGDAVTIEQMFVRKIPKSARNEEDILKLCGLHHTNIARKAAGMLGVVAA